MRCCLSGEANTSGRSTGCPLPAGSNRFLIAYYGSGAKPIITAAKILNIPSGWAQHTTGVWKIDLTNPATHNGWKGTVASNGGSGGQRRPP